MKYSTEMVLKLSSFITEILKKNIYKQQNEKFLINLFNCFLYLISRNNMQDI